MTLRPGTRLGPYELISEIGAGGMGEVYRARDTRLDRTIAIKILPGAVVSDPARRARFEREARAISALDHPNICILHDVGREGDLEYLVMQLIEGETLAARLARGPLPLEDALRYGAGIAAALDTAHRAGILHRDLKPGNIMLARSGARETSAKLLDFGLAKLVMQQDAVGPPTQATISAPLTGEGTILGTLLYMSPEQLEGRELDARSDIFSFGAVLYEMVTGVRAFDGPSQASIIGAILERDPEPIVNRLPLAPPALDRLVRKCLAKDPERRWQSAADLGDELSWIAQSSGLQQALAPGPTPPRGWRRLRLPAAVGAIGALAAALAWAALPRERDAGEEPARILSVALPGAVHLVSGGLAISPDGQTIAYVASGPGTTGGSQTRQDAGGQRLYLRPFASTESTPLAGSEGARAPFFAPDGSALAFFTETELVRISLTDGTRVVVASTPPVTRGGTWLPDDTIVLTPTQGSPLYRLAAGSETATPLTVLNTSAGEQAHMWPSALPDGSAVLYSVRRGTTLDQDDMDAAVYDLRTGTSRTVLARAAYARYSPSGHLLFLRGDALMSVPFDAGTREVRGAPARIADGIAASPWIGGVHLAVAPDGTVVFMRGKFGGVRTSPVWVDRAGRTQPWARFHETDLGSPRISPDGKHVVFDGTSREGDAEIYIAAAARGTTIRVNPDPADDFNPIWTPDGKRIIWTRLSAGRLPHLVWRAADGSGAAEEVVTSGEAQFAGSVSPDYVFAYTQATGRSSADIWVTPLKGERKGRPFIAGRSTEYGPEFSPDGKWIAYVSDEGGTPDVYVVPYPGPGQKRRVTSGGGRSPAWSRDGRELFYQSSSGMMAVSVSNAQDLEFGDPRHLFSGTFRSDGREDGPRAYDVMPGGDRFLMIKEEQTASDRPLSMDVFSRWWRR